MNRHNTDELLSSIKKLGLNMKSIGAFLIETERSRQIEFKGWDAKLDDTYINSELLDAAGCYASSSYTGSLSKEQEEFVQNCWPFKGDDEKFKPTNKIANLAKAGALIAAEIDRLIRAEEGVEEDEIS